ncbi:hypothetical protein LINGRAHAP2_LOCUS17860 [Linum grandiflorum]
MAGTLVPSRSASPIDLIVAGLFLFLCFYTLLVTNHSAPVLETRYRFLFHFRHSVIAYGIASSRHGISLCRNSLANYIKLFDVVDHNYASETLARVHGKKSWIISSAAASATDLQIDLVR